MPRRTLKRKIRRKRVGTRKKANRIVKHATIGKSLGFPTKNVVQLRYATMIELNSSVGELDLHIFRCNGINDPDVTGTGHQPLGRDQWVEFYNHYRVLEAKIRIEFAAESQQTGQSPRVSGVYLSDDTSVPAAWTTLVESGRGSYVLAHNINTETKYLSATYNQNSFFKGQGPNQAQLGAAVGADPTEQAYFVVYQQPGNETDAAVVGSYMIVIDYLVEFSEPKDLAQS